MSKLPEDVNPYQAPLAYPGVADAVRAEAIDPSVVEKFRDEIVALGAFWIIVSFFIGFLSYYVFDINGNRNGFASALLAAMSLLWLALGIFTCMKRMWAVYIGLGISYLNLIGMLLNLSLCGILMFFAVIVQAHRVIKWARQIQAAGLPLDVKP
jgi:hypothetical protein